MNIDIFQLPEILARRFRLVMIIAVLCIVVALGLVLRMTPTFTSSAELLLDPNGLASEALDLKGTPATTRQDQPNIDSQIFVMQSSNVMRAVVERLSLADDLALVPRSAVDKQAAAVEALKTKVKVERQGQSLVFTIAAEHPDAKRAADIANAVAEIYLQQLDQSRSDAARRASTTFQIQASELRDRVLKAELAVEQFKSENGLATTGQQGLVIEQQVAGLSEQLTAARVAEEQAQTAYDQVRNLTVASLEGGATPEVLQSTTIGLLRDRYAVLVDRRTQLATNLGANHPQLRAINSQVANMQQAIQGELDRIRQSMKVSYDRAAANTKALTQRLDSLTATSFDSGAAQIRMRQLENEADAVRTLYKTFLNRAEELGQQQTVNTDNSRIITAATPLPKSSAKLKILILIAAALFGTIAGACLAVLSEILVGNRTEEKATTSDHDLPIIATLKFDAAKPKGIWQRLSAIGTSGEPENATDGSQDIHEAARRILAEIEVQRPYNLMFTKTGDIVTAAGITTDLVQAFTEEGEYVAYASGPLAARRPKAPRRAGRPSVNAVLARDEHLDLPLSNLLHYDMLDAAKPASPAPTSRKPKVSAFAPREARREGDLIVINACGTDITQHLPELSDEADAIAIIIRHTDLRSKSLSAHLAAFGDNLDKVIGLVVVESD
ncbi:GumC family protein [Rhizobium sp. G187]|uniref:GumC family protein n=1 Tax=Rhizobium sp. G187 TaxID=3451352 RepID=UPI003EE7272D